MPADRVIVPPMHAGGNHPDWFARLAVAIPALLLLVMTGLYLNERGREHRPLSEKQELDAGLDRVIPDIDIRKRQLNDVARAIEKAGNVRIKIEWYDLRAYEPWARLGEKRLAGGRVRDVLDHMQQVWRLDDVHVYWYALDGVIHIAVNKHRLPSVTRTYDVAGLLAAARHHHRAIGEAYIRGATGGAPPTASQWAQINRAAELAAAGELRDWICRAQPLINMYEAGLMPHDDVHIVGDRLIVTTDISRHRAVLRLLRDLEPIREALP